MTRTGKKIPGELGVEEYFCLSRAQLCSRESGGVCGFTGGVTKEVPREKSEAKNEVENQFIRLPRKGEKKKSFGMDRKKRKAYSAGGGGKEDASMERGGTVHQEQGFLCWTDRRKIYVEVLEKKGRHSVARTCESCPKNSEGTGCR